MHDGSQLVHSKEARVADVLSPLRSHGSQKSSDRSRDATRMRTVEGRIKGMSENIGLYVDCGSLWHGSYAFNRASGSSNQKPRVDYKSLLESVLGPEKAHALKRAYLVGRTKVNMDGFREALGAFGYQVKCVNEFAPGSKTARMVMLGDIMAEAATWDRIIVATQDPFFSAALCDLKMMGKKVEVACFGALPAEYSVLGVAHSELDQSVIFSP